MRLKSIKLAGFKSFVDPTIANFPQDLTAVVGPNGCGKSNIIDAIRWVMGESSAKHLRGESMADVIFNGSSARKPVAQASIELIFDNADGTVGGEYGGFSEIAVKRLVTRDGQSSYFLNSAKCRRRDISDIFLGTGLGPRSYAIIEQGMISRLIEAKPEELRVYIEEAAGISKYKARRRETENRIRRTRDNLERLADLREELGRQLERLSRQAAAAEKYRNLKDEERLVSAQLKALRWQGLDDQVSQLDQAIAELELKVEAQVTHQGRADTEIEQLRQQHHDAQDHFNRIQQHYYSLGADVARLEQQIQHAQQQQKQRQEEWQQVIQQWQDAHEHLETDRAALEELVEQEEALRPQSELLAAQQEESAMALAAAEEAMQAWQQEWDQFNIVSSDAKRHADVAKSSIQHLDASLERLTDRLNRLQQEGAALNASPLLEEVAELEEQIALQQDTLDNAMVQSDQCQQALMAQRQQNNQNSQEIEQRQDQLQQLKSRHASLHALQRAALGDDDGVAAWLAQHELEQAPRLSQQLDVEAGWETAVEMVLGSAINALSVEGLDVISEWLPSLSSGHISLAIAGGDGARNDAANLLRQRVNGAVPEGLFAGVHAVDTLADAMALRASLKPHESVVTRCGIWLAADWLKVTRAQDDDEGVLARRKELETLDADILAAEEQIEQLKARLSDGREQIADLELQREAEQRQISDVNRQLGELQAQLSARQVRLEQVQMRRQRLDTEQQEVAEQLDREQQQLAAARSDLETALQAMSEDTDRREALLSDRDDRRAGLDACRQRARQDRDREHQLAMDMQGITSQANALRQSLARLEPQVEALAERKAQLEAQAIPDGDNDETLAQALEEKLALRMDAEQQLADARSQSEDVDHAMRELESKRGQHEREANDLRNTLAQRRMLWQELVTRRQTIAEQLAEARFDLAAVVAALPEDADEKTWSASLDSIGQRISRLGQINLAAIEEYEQQSARKAYLDQQNGDLEEALNTLESAIRRIDKETRQRFKDYFDRINAGLQTLFPKVFGGGSAYLELTGDDLLDTGVAIMARPPGKRNSTIHLLSGGEKALTALSLVFSIFQLNPAPFCLLDEVDAPLDDANVGRFCRLVEEMSDKVQFIYITHNKIAMEMATSLMGVTMHEAGVSRLVAVNVEEAAEMAAL